MRSSMAVILLVAAALPACSHDETTGSSSTGGGPDPNGPAGAVNMEVYSTPDQTCPPGNFHIDVGNTKITPSELVLNGESDTTIACSVIPTSGKFATTGSIKQGDLDWSVKDLLTDGTSATGTVSFVDPSGSGRYTSSMTHPCVFQFAPGSKQGISTGDVFVQFDCSDLVSEADATKSCSSRYGYVQFERCVAK